MTINEIRNKRAKAVEAAKAFLESHRQENGTLSAEDDATYTGMEIRTGLSHAQLSHMMDVTTWMNAKKAIELGFADDILTDEKLTAEVPAYAFSGKAAEAALLNKLTAKTAPPKEPTAPEEKPGRSVNELMERLNLIKP